MKHAPTPNTFRDAWAGDLTAARCRHRGPRGRLGPSPPRPRRADLHRPARPLGARAARRPPAGLRRRLRRWPRTCAPSTWSPPRARSSSAPRRTSTRTSPPARSRSTCARCERLAASETPPFPIDEDTPVDEMIRLQHRMLDLRRESMREAMELRHQIVATMREVLNERDFLEIETPILTRSTPEGARDFLVPSRLQPGSWYALPQSPQLFKQLLMMSGYERYYQIARCFRDEDLRADRQPEFTQLDVEMSFVDEDDVLDTMEAVMGAVFAGHRLRRAGPAVAAHGLRRGDAALRLGPPRPALRPRDRRRLPGAARQRVQGLRVGPRRRRRGARAQRRRARDVALGARGAQRGRPAPRRQGGGVGLRRERRHALADRQVPRRGPRGGGRRPSCGAAEGDLLLFVADQPRVAAEALGALRLELGRRFGLIPEGGHDVLWVVDFPMFEPTDDGWGARAPPVHRADRRLRRSRARCARAATT